MAKQISGYIKLTYTEAKALLNHFATNNVAPPRELYQCLAMLDEYFSPKKIETEVESEENNTTQSDNSE